MSDIDPFAYRPLYEESQVVTFQELLLMYEGFILMYNTSKWYEIGERKRLRVAMGVINGIASWMKNGKPVIRAGGQPNEKTT
jgi:hypothetical protein